MAYSLSINPEIQRHMRRVKRWNPDYFLRAVEIKARINEKDKWSAGQRAGYRNQISQYFKAIQRWDGMGAAPERSLPDPGQDHPKGPDYLHRRSRDSKRR